MRKRKGAARGAWEGGVRQAEPRVVPGGRAGVRPPPGVSSAAGVKDDAPVTGGYYMAKANAQMLTAPHQLTPINQMTAHWVGPT